MLFRGYPTVHSAILAGWLALAACSDSKHDDIEDAASGEDKKRSAKSDAGTAGDESTDASTSAPKQSSTSKTGTGDGARKPASSLMLPTTMEHPNVAPWFNIYRPEDLAATGAPLPVVVWANGGCYRSDFTWEILFNRWASGGFFVLALTEDPEKGAMVQTNIDDQAGLVRWVREQAEAKDSPYAGKLDTDHIVAAGNSCGGVTALGLTAQDQDIAATFVLSGSSGFGAANRAVIDLVQVPVGYIVGGSTDIAGANATSDYDALAEGVPAMIVSRFEGDHRTVSTDPAILTDEAEISLNWMDLALFGTPAAYDELTAKTVCSKCEDGHYMLKSKHLDTLKTN